MAKHARLSPSKADLWMVCPGGLPFAESLRDEIAMLGFPESSPVAMAGTLAHEYSEACILANLHPVEVVREQNLELSQELRPKLDSVLQQNAEMYASWATGFVTTRPNIPWGVELSASLWYEPESKGTADFWAVEGDTLIVVDYKSGRVPVHVQGNLQIAIYLIAIYDAIKPFNPQIRNFRAGIHQPFCMPPGKRDPFWWDFDFGELDRLRSVISAGAREVFNPIAGQHRLVVSEKGCRYCPAKVFCPAQKVSMDKFLGLLPCEPSAIDGHTLFSIFKDLSQLRNFLDSIEEYVRSQPVETLTINGFEKKAGAMRRSWQGDTDEVAQNLENIGIVEPFLKVLKSPAQVEKELGSDDLISTFVKVDYNRPRIVNFKKDEPTFRVSTKE